MSSPPAARKNGPAITLRAWRCIATKFAAETNKLDWLFSTHTTSRSAAELLLFLHSGMMVSKGSARTATVKAGRQRMIAGLPLTFAEPLLLLGLLSLPVLWWLLRVMPPRPRRVEFPPTRLLFDIAPKEETPSRTPWWLTALRLLAAALVILAAAGPIWNPQTGPAGTRAPLVILLDDGWSAAASWEARIKAADELIANADNDRRGIALVPLSEPARDITIMPGGTARVALRQLAPKPYSIERVETLPAIERFLKADRRLRDRLAVGWRRYRTRNGVSRRPGQDHRGSRADDF